MSKSKGKIREWKERGYITPKDVQLQIARIDKRVERLEKEAQELEDKNDLTAETFKDEISQMPIIIFNI
jgi:hypothetical protein